jgi:octopine/nopaline transport system permease protein
VTGFVDFITWYWALMGPGGWGPSMVAAAGMTVAVAGTGFVLGAGLGSLIAAAKLSESRPLRAFGDAYTTILRGIPDLLVIYLFYFGGSAALGAVLRLFGGQGGFVGVPAFATGALAIAIVSAAYQAEVFRGAYKALARGELEAARSVGMGRALMFRRIVAPQTLRFAIPGLGNVWQLALKESALISVTGLVELLRQSHVGAGSTRQPFVFYLTGAALYLVITTVSTWGFQRAEDRAMRGFRRA